MSIFSERMLLRKCPQDQAQSSVSHCVQWGSRPGPSDDPGMEGTAAGVLGIHRRLLQPLWDDDV